MRRRVIRLTESEWLDLLAELQDSRSALLAAAESAPVETPAKLERASTALGRAREAARRIQSEATAEEMPPALRSYHRGRAAAAAELLKAMAIPRGKTYRRREEYAVKNPLGWDDYIPLPRPPSTITLTTTTLHGETVVIDPTGGVWTTTLTTTTLHGETVVIDPTGGVWIPDEDAAAEAGGDNTALIAICETDPMRGTWAQ